MVRHDPNSSEPNVETLEADPRSKRGAHCDVTREIDHGRTTVVFERDFATSRPTLWNLLTAPDQLRLWAPHTADRNLAHVGRVTFTLLGDEIDGHADIPEFEMSGVVLVVDAPVLLEHSGATDVLAWHLDEVAEATHLTLRQTLANDTMASAVAAGWHLCFEVADSLLAGHPVPPIRGSGAMRHGWADLNRRYAKALGVAPTKLG